MAANTKNKFPADRAGSKYSEFRNTRRFTQSKPKEAVKQIVSGDAGSKSGQSPAQTSAQTSGQAPVPSAGQATGQTG